MKTRTVAGIGLLAALVAGCGTGSEMPLKVGRSWTYSVRTNFITRVEQVRVQRELSVGGVQGYELGGPLGVSRVAWKNGTLIGERLANASLEPPIPLLVSRDGKAVRKWAGTLESAAGKDQAHGVLRQSKERLTLGGRPIETLRSDLTVKSGGHEIRLVTNYLDGFGIIKQTHHTDGSFDLELMALGGY